MKQSIVIFLVCLIVVSSISLHSESPEVHADIHNDLKKFENTNHNRACQKRETHPNGYNNIIQSIVAYQQSMKRDSMAWPTTRWLVDICTAWISFWYIIDLSIESFHLIMSLGNTSEEFCMSALKLCKVVLAREVALTTLGGITRLTAMVSN